MRSGSGGIGTAQLTARLPYSEFLHLARRKRRRQARFRDHCDGAFSDVTNEAGLASPVTSTQAAVWLDIDNHGSLDLFVGNENGPASSAATTATAGLPLSRRPPAWTALAQSAAHEIVHEAAVAEAAG